MRFAKVIASLFSSELFRDPQGSRTDAELIETLQRAWLLPKNGDIDAAAEAKFSLDSAVGDDGGNFSAGEKQLLALCRALVKNSRIIVLVFTFHLASPFPMISSFLRTKPQVLSMWRQMA